MVNETDTYTYKLIGGARDGEEGKHDMGEEGGIVDNMLFVHPNIPTLHLHYRLESLYTNEAGELDTIDYIFIREFNSSNFDEYTKFYLEPLGDDTDG